MESLATYQQRAVNALTPSYGARESQNIVRFWLEVRGGFSRMDLVLRGTEEVELDWFDADLERLIALEPIHYVVGCAYFMEQLLEVNATTLVPRPETEELVRHMVDYISNAPIRTLVDVGTGSGCIALGIKSLRSAWEVTGIDVQAGAVAVAKRNAGAWGLKVGFKQQDVRTMDRFTEDVIVSNPPYIPRSEGVTMDKHVVSEEPDVALFVPDDQPLEYYEMILEKGTRMAPERSRYFGFEIHEDFGPEMVELGHRYGLKNVELVPDLQGKDRMIFGRYDG